MLTVPRKDGIHLSADRDIRLFEDPISYLRGHNRAQRLTGSTQQPANRKISIRRPQVSWCCAALAFSRGIEK
jgi:hypothetical protein